MNSIKDYKLIKVFYETEHTRVYVADKDSKKYFLTELAGHYPAPSETAQLKKEFSIRKESGISGIITPYEIVDTGSVFAVASEFVDGVSLKSYIKSGKKLSIKKTVSIGLKIAKALMGLHSLKLIHRDVRNSNIIVENNSGKVFLADFGLSAVTSKMGLQIYNPKTIEDTLTYISPEQTGRMNRDVDFRTDFYSLGISLYELFCGRPPFISEDPLEIIHSHIARKPLSLKVVNDNIPAALSLITDRLLAKTAEERYQSSKGLIYDLNFCKINLTENNTIADFKLGLRDIPEQLTIPQIIVGREKELELLLTSFSKFCGGEKIFITVSGEPGVGKSALINEIQKPIVARRGHFLSGKYDQMRKDIPYSAIIQAIQLSLRQTLSEKAEVIEIRRNELLKAMGTNGKVLIDIIPDIAKIVGEQPPVMDLPRDEAQNRFFMVFKNFINVFAKPESPMVLFLDDLQWADAASLILIQKIVSDPEIPSLFVIGSYRDNEVGLTHPLVAVIDDIKKNKVRIEHIVVKSLNEKHILSIFANIFPETDDRLVQLSEIVFKKTGGNPFFVMQFIKTLYDDGLIGVDDNGAYRWDSEAITTMQITDNVVDMMIQKIKKLPDNCITVLKTCACIGNRFDLETISEAMDITIDKVYEDMDGVIASGLVGVYRNYYRFHHDRIQEAAYSLMDDSEKIKLHYKIGNYVLNKTSDDTINDKIFYIVHHLNISRTLIIAESEKRVIAGLNYSAGLKAKGSSAFETAASFFKSAAYFLDEQSWTINYDMTYNVYHELSECLYIIGKYDEASEIFNKLKNKCKNEVDLASLYCTQIQLLTSETKYTEAVSLGREALALLGAKLPKKVSIISVIMLTLKLKWKLSKITVQGLYNLPMITDERILSMLKTRENLGSASLYLDKNLNLYNALSASAGILYHGHCSQSPLGLSVLSSVLAVGLGDLKTAKELGDVAIKLSDTIKNTDRAMALFSVAYFIKHWFIIEKDVIPMFKEAHQLFMDRGNKIFAGHCISNILHFSLSAGINLEDVYADYSRFKELIISLNDNSAYNHYLDNIRWYDVLKLNSQICEKSRLELIAKGSPVEKYLYYSEAAWLNYLLGNFPDARKYLLLSDPYQGELKGTIHDSEYYYHSGLISAKCYETANSKERKLLKKHVITAKKKLNSWDKSLGNIFTHKAMIINAEMDHIDGKFQEAETNYKAAIISAEKTGHIHNAAAASLRLAQCYLKMNRHDPAKEYFAMAIRDFSKWGADAVCKYIEKEFADFVSVSEMKMPADQSLSKSTALDLASAMKASRAIAGEIQIARVLEKIMEIVLENAGAQKGYLILADGENLLIEARGVVDTGKISVLESIDVSGYEGVSPSIINYVNRTGTDIILDNAYSDSIYKDDPYIKNGKIHSLLCMAIKNQGKISAILFLENNLLNGAFTRDRLELLQLLSAQAAVSIDNARLYADLEKRVDERTRELKEARDALWGEMKLAAKIQTVLLPKKPFIEGYEIHGLMIPADDVGGDYYDVIKTDNAYWAIIGDVSGHGVPAGLVMMMTQTAIQTILRGFPIVSPSEMLNKINSIISYNVAQLEEDKYMTITAFRFDNDGTVAFSGLHQDLIIYRAKNGTTDIIETNGVWLGLDFEMGRTIKDDTFKMESGDVLLLYTDGISESRNAEGVMFDEACISESVIKHGEKSSKEIAEGLLTDLEGFTNNDDRTILVIKKL